MLLQSQTMLMRGIGEPTLIQCHDYANVIDVDIFEGGYSEYYYRLYYTIPDKPIDNKLNKKVYLICLHEPDNNAFGNSNHFEIDEKYKFLKSIEIENRNVKYKRFIFVYEEPGVSESRDIKLGNIL